LVQFSPHQYWHGNGGNKVSTRLLAIECSRNDSKEVRERLYRKMMFVPEELKYGNTRNFHYLPFAATPTSTNDLIRNPGKKILLAIADVQLKYINNVDWTFPGTAVSFRQYVLKVKTINNSNLFLNVEIAGGYDKIHLLTTKENLDHAKSWIDDTIQDLRTRKLDPTTWTSMGHMCIFQRVDQM